MMFSKPKVVRKMNLRGTRYEQPTWPRGASKMKNSIGCLSTKGLPTVMFHDSRVSTCTRVYIILGIVPQHGTVCSAIRS